MINMPNNWNEVKEYSDRQKLPLGAYVCRVKKAVLQDTDYGQQLCILFDIEDGEYKGFYAEDFKNSTYKDKKWKGVLRVWLPKNDGSEKDEWTKSTLKGMVTAFEKSNPGYQWNWDENSLAGKVVGILFRNEEWEYEGKTGWTARPFKAISTDTVVDGKYTLPKDKPLKNKTAAPVGYSAPVYEAPAASQFTMLDDDDSDLPF